MLYEKFCSRLAQKIPVKTGLFGAKMDVYIINDGPATFVVDSKEFE